MHKVNFFFKESFGHFEGFVGRFDVIDYLFYAGVGLFYAGVGLFYASVGLFYARDGRFYARVCLFYVKVGRFYVKVGRFYVKVGRFYVKVGWLKVGLGRQIGGSRLFYAVLGCIGALSVDIYNLLGKEKAAISEEMAAFLIFFYFTYCF